VLASFTEDDMADELKRLRRELSRGERGRGKRYDEGLKQRTIAWAMKRRREGASWSVIADELSIGFDTVRRWCVTVKSSKSRALVPVRIVTGATESRGVSVVSASGHRVDGLSLAEAATILRELG
jgi:hypothetical protein